MVHRVFGISFLLFTFFTITHTYAQQKSFLRGFGGMVVATPQDLHGLMVCSAEYGAFMISPIASPTPGPFFIRNLNKNIPAKSSHVLGLYNQVPNPTTCINPETGAGIPTFEVTTYNASKKSFFSR